MRLLWVLILSLLVISGYSQVDIPASFPNGDVAYDAYLQANLKFPDLAFKAKQSAEIRVLVSIDTFGKVAIESFIFPNTGLGFEEEVTRFIDNMPLWNPAYRDGEISTAQTILIYNFTYEPPKEETQKKQIPFYKDCEVLPTFIGGKDSVETFLESVLTDSFNQSFDTITAEIQFIIGAKGKVIFAEVLTHSGDVEQRTLVAAIKMLPNCTAGTINNKPVNVQRKMIVTLYSDDADLDVVDN